MWKKNEPRPYTHQAPSPPPVGPTEAPRKSAALIGPSISITGDVSGDENLEIQGRVEGSISLKKHNVTVGKTGHVKADIQAKIIRVAGEVHGDLIGEEEVVIHQSGRVQGNITASRVTLENGSKFKGSIDMEPKDQGGSSFTSEKSGGNGRLNASAEQGSGTPPA